MSTADAVAREAAWLKTSGDGLPALLVGSGGRFDNVFGYIPRSPNKRERNVYVTRRGLQIRRSANIRQMATHEFRLIVDWPMTNSTGDSQQCQADFDAAIDDLLARISGQILDKTHGGRFLSVAEGDAPLRVEFGQLHDALWIAEVGYSADDVETNG